MTRPRNSSLTEICKSASVPVRQISKEAPKATIARLAAARTVGRHQRRDSGDKTEEGPKDHAGRGALCVAMGEPQSREGRADPGFGEQGRDALDARGERLVGESRRHLSYCGGKPGAEQHQGQNRRNAAMSGNGAQAVEEIGEGRFARAGRLFVVGRRAQQRHRGEIDALADNVGGESG